MILATLMLAFVGEAKATVQAPDLHVVGRPFPVSILLEAPAEGASIDGWRLTPAGFALDGKPLAEQGQETALVLAQGEKKSVSVDLAAALPDSGDFQLSWNGLPAKKVRVLQPAPKGLNFMADSSTPAADLDQYWVLLRTNRGDVLTRFWPDVAPNHVRNFLDLSYTGFYDGLTFHRVIPGFMIQGGDPDGSGMGNGPRRLKAEFNAKKHVRGVLSMARSSDPNSASSQFFIMHQSAPSLDNAYSGFGQVVSGMDAVDRIVNTKRGQNDRPHEPQIIEHAIVVQVPADPASFEQGN